MTKQSRRKFSAEFKAKVALEAIKNEKTMAEIGHQFEINPVTISKWKNEFLERMAVIFENGTSKKSHQDIKLFLSGNNVIFFQYQEAHCTISRSLKNRKI